jgi:ABC-type lipoprotein export system ATPase subunit
MSEKMALVTKNIKKSFWQGRNCLEVLRGISVEFKQEETYAVTGVSGSGKSTFIHILGGLDKPTSGFVEINKKDVFKIRRKNLFLNQTMGFVFQSHYLIKELNVLENIMLMGMIKGEDRSFCRERAKDLLEMIGLHDKGYNYPGQLSGGEQQRVSIVRAIFNKPKFLLADEPTGNLDEGYVNQIIELFLQAVREWRMGLIVCTHDKNVYQKMNFVLKLHEGILEQKKN